MRLGATLALSAPAAGTGAKTARASVADDRPAKDIPIKKRRENNKTAVSGAAKLAWTLIITGSSLVCHSSDLSSALPAAGSFFRGHPKHHGACRLRAFLGCENLLLIRPSTSGPIVMVVGVTEQRAYVYRNGILIGATTVSTGRPGHVTPTGVFTVLQKQKEHRSTIYDGAPMPYMERLTWGGVALHAGGLPGYPESHGCIHLPSEFARLLFDISPNGMTVVIGSDATAPERVAHPGYLKQTKSPRGVESRPRGPS